MEVDDFVSLMTGGNNMLPFYHGLTRGLPPIAGKFTKTKWGEEGRHNLCLTK